MENFEHIRGNYNLVVSNRAWISKANLDRIYLLKVDNGGTRTMCEICSKLIVKTPERPHWVSKLLNPFSTNAPLLYALETSENLRVFYFFRGYRSGALAENGLIKILRP